jgi:hypothetical protein
VMAGVEGDAPGGGQSWGRRTWQRLESGETPSPRCGLAWTGGMGDWWWPSPSVAGGVGGGSAWVVGHTVVGGRRRR